MINRIISFLPKHPTANLLFYHIYYSEEEDGRPFYQEYFNELRDFKLTYKYGMERALEKYLRKVEQLNFMKKIGYHRFCRTVDLAWLKAGVRRNLRC